MKILVGKTFGIGNAVLSVPMVKALATLGEVDVLLGSTPDDFGSPAIFSHLERAGIVRRIWIATQEGIPFNFRETYDVAVMAIPFDDRWRNGAHFNAREVIDGRKRPGNVERLGFDMWEKHEVLYQMENAYQLGYSGPVPSPSFLPPFPPEVLDEDLVYLGIGYKRDAGGFGLSKHFGNDRFVELMRAIRERRPGTKFISTGGVADFIQTGVPLMKRIADKYVYSCGSTPHLSHAFDIIRGCKAYLGNDTGMMHVAASLGIPTHALLLSQDLARKNHPWGPPAGRWMGSSLDADVGEIADYFVKLVWGEGVSG